MLDRRLVSEQPDLVRTVLRRRHAGADAFATLDRFEELERERKTLLAESEGLRRVRNELSPRIGALVKLNLMDEADALKTEVHEANDKVKDLEIRLAEVDREVEDILLRLPNVLLDEVPDGVGEDEAVEYFRWGDIPTFDFEPRSHDDLGVELGILDFERAARMSGARFAVLKGAGALLERALINYFLDVHTRRHGYVEVMVPYMVWRDTMQGTGQLPKFEEELFKLSKPVNGQDMFLVPTAEVPVTNLHRDEILEASALPLRYVCFTPCFRAEAGSYGKDTKGLIRQHQFHKVELVHITTPETSREAHVTLIGHAESILQDLGLPYRKVRIAAGDASSAAASQVDLEVWLPSQGRYREISSCSNFLDYQARRMMLRYRTPAESGRSRTAWCHTLNGSGLAVGRTLVAILENYQQADGSVVVPMALRPWVGGLDLVRRPG
jgi:seryl-tRNA synthetase